MHRPSAASTAPRTARACAAVLLAAWLVLLLPAQARAQGEAKEKVAVMKLQGVGANESETEAITDRMREVLLKTGRFTMVDRSQMEAILTEQALQQTTCTDQACAVQAGRILGVRKIVTGKVVKFSENAWQVSALMVDVETAETVSADSVRHQGDVFSLLDHQVPLLGSRLLNTGAAVAAAPVVPPPAQPPPAAPAGVLATLAGQWSEGPRLLVGRSGHAAAVLGGQVYAIGGQDEKRNPLRSVEVLVPGTNAWSEGPALPTPRFDAAAAVLQGRLYLIGGNTGEQVTERVEVLEGGQWRPGPALPSPREGAVAATLNGRLYVIGGRDATGEVLDQVLALAPSGGAWQPVAPLAEARVFATAQAAEGRLYVFGGRRRSGGLGLFSSVLVSSVVMYRPEGNRWERKGELPLTLSHAASATVGRGIYLFGGFAGSSVMMSPRDRYWLYSVEREAWIGPPGSAGKLSTPMGRVGSGLVRTAAAVLPDRVLLIGGEPEHHRRVSEVR